MFAICVKMKTHFGRVFRHLQHEQVNLGGLNQETPTPKYAQGNIHSIDVYAYV